MCVYIHIYIYFFFFFAHSVFEILVPGQGWNPHPLQWRRRVLTTGPPGKSPYITVSRSFSCSWLSVPTFPPSHCAVTLQHCEGSTRCPVANQAHRNVGDSLESSWGFEPHLGLLFQHLLMVPVFLLNLLAIQSKTHLPLFHTVSIPGASSSLSSFHGMLDLFLRI